MDDEENESLVHFSQPLPNPRKSNGPDIPMSTYETLNLQSDSSDEEAEEIEPAVLLND